MDEEQEQGLEAVGKVLEDEKATPLEKFNAKMWVLLGCKT